MAGIDEIDAVLRNNAVSLAASFRTYNGISEIIKKNSQAITKMLQPYDVIAKQMKAIRSAFTPDLGMITRMQEIVSAFQPKLPDFAACFQLSNTIYEVLRSTELLVPSYLGKLTFDWSRMFSAASDMSTSYDALLTVVENRTVFPEFVPAYLLKPSLSVSSQYRTLSSLRVLDADLESDVSGQYDREVEEDGADTESLVASVDPTWLVPLHGADVALRSNNPDKVRHAVSSLRELVTTILHYFAPDESVKASLSDGHWYDNGRPTRRARLHFILEKKYGNDALMDFLDKDIEATIQLFDLYNKGTHEIVSTLTPAEVHLVLARSKVLIGALIISGKSGTS